MPAASISARPQHLDAARPASARARSASAVGVRSLARRVLQVARGVDGLGRARRRCRPGRRRRGGRRRPAPAAAARRRRRSRTCTRGTRRRRARVPSTRPRGLRVVDVVRELPAQRASAELARAADGGRGGDAGALGVELVARAEPDQQVAPALGVRRPRACAAPAVPRRSRRAPAARRPRRRARSPRPRRGRWRSCRRRSRRGCRSWLERAWAATLVPRGGSPGN